MSPPAASALQDYEAEEGLDPALLRVLEALARAHVEEDYAAALADSQDRR